MARPRSADARQRAMIAAVEALLDVGVEGTTVEEIATRSGVAKSTLYRHFGTRESLLGEAVRSYVVVASTPDTGTLAGDLRELFARWDGSEDSRRLNELFPLLLDLARRESEMMQVMSELLAERQRPLRTVLRLAQARREIDPDLDLDVAMAMVLGPLTYWRMVQDREITEDFIALVIPASVSALQSTVAR